MDLIVDFPQWPSDNLRPRVSFAPRVELISIDDLALEHKSDMWFSSEEMLFFKRSTALALHCIKSWNLTIAEYAEMHAQDTSAFMGLENHLSENATGGVRRRRDAIGRAVKTEQRRQADAGVGDPEALSAVAEYFSEFSRRRARVIGLLHAQP